MSSLRLGILSDLHRTTDARARAAFHNEYDFAGHADRVERALAWFGQELVDVLVLCGDLTHSASENAMTAVLGECCAALNVPVIAVTGNHDVGRGEDMLAQCIQHVADPRIVTGDPSGEVIGGIRMAGVQVAPASGYSRSRLRALPTVDDWGDAPVVLVSHLPLLSRASAVAARGMPYPGDLLDREHAAALVLARNAATIVLCGHIHARDAYLEGTVLQLMQAALVEPPFEATVLDVRADADGGVVADRRTRRTGDRRAADEPAIADPVGSWRFANGRWAVAAAAARSAHNVIAAGNPIALVR